MFAVNLNHIVALHLWRIVVAAKFVSHIVAAHLLTHIVATRCCRPFLPHMSSAPFCHTNLASHFWRTFLPHISAAHLFRTRLPRISANSPWSQPFYSQIRLGTCILAAFVATLCATHFCHTFVPHLFCRW